MPDADSSAELRMLRAKAYGPGGELSADELARLEELEGRNVRSVEEGERLRLPAAGAERASASRSVAQPVSSSAAAPPSLNDPQEHPAGEGPHRDVVVEDAGEGAGDDFFGALSERSETKRAEQAERAEASVETPATSRRRWPLVAASIAGILAIGFGVGWAVWGWDRGSTTLAIAHSGEQAELDTSGDYDPGTVVPVGADHGIVVWQAYRSNGEEVCVIVTTPDRTQEGCVPVEALADYTWPNATVSVPEGQEDAGSQLVAGLIPTLEDGLVPFIQVWGPDSYDWQSQYNEAELAQVRALEASGYPPEQVSIIGYDAETIVWSTYGAEGFCIMIVRDGVDAACQPDQREPLTLSATVNGVPTQYVVTQSDMRGAVLTVYKNVDLGYSSGSSDDPMFDDLFTDAPAIDDKTGE